MADPREFDEKGILRRRDIFMDSHGLQKLANDPGASLRSYP
jgi:hypothetical protein